MANETRQTSRRDFLALTGGSLVGAASVATVARAQSQAGSKARPLPAIEWKKQGLVISPEGAPAWRAQHSGMVSVLPWENDTYRMFLTGGWLGENRERRFHIGWLDLTRDFKILHENENNPVLAQGRMGTFDCNGLCMPWVVRLTDSVLYMYYVAWGLAPPGLLHNNAGLAISRDNGRTWKRYSEASILPLDDQDPVGTGTVSVIREEKDYWRMWYTCIHRWEPRPEGGYLLYDFIKYAESDDGIHWRKPKDNIAIGLLPDEHAAARPMVLKEKDGYRMWFSHIRKGSTYRIGYAESPDGITWTRRNCCKLEPSPSGWDSEMIEYAYVIRENDGYRMFYNGNGFGQTGTGMAVGKLVRS